MTKLNSNLNITSSIFFIVYFNKNKKKILEKIRKEPNAQAKEIGHVCLTFLFVQGQIKSCMPFYFSQKELKQIMRRFLFKILAIRKVLENQVFFFVFLDSNNYLLHLF